MTDDASDPPHDVTGRACVCVCACISVCQRRREHIISSLCNVMQGDATSTQRGARWVLVETSLRSGGIAVPTTKGGAVSRGKEVQGSDEEVCRMWECVIARDQSRDQGLGLERMRIGKGLDADETGEGQVTPRTPFVLRTPLLAQRHT